jgi:hypothetical protein
LGEVIDLDKLHLFDATGRQLLHNGDFSDGLSRWFFAGRHYFVPWHIDNLFLEMLIDQVSSACCCCSPCSLWPGSICLTVRGAGMTLPPICWPH